MKTKTLLSIAIGLFIVINLDAQKDDPVIELLPYDSLSCMHYDFNLYQWLAYPIDAEIENAYEISWTTTGDGTFSDPGIEQPEYILGMDDKLNQTVNLSVIATGNGTTVSADITLHIPLQLIPITKDGWTGISTYVDKTDTPVPDVMAPVVDHLNIMINQEGTSYWPEPIPPINNLGNWASIGYQAKFFDPPACLPVYGEPIQDQTFYLEYPFTYLPVFTDQLVDIEDLFGDNINKIFELRDWKDSLIWTPDNPTFDYLKPGLAYLVILEMGNEPFTVEFPNYSWDIPIGIEEQKEPEISVAPNPSHGKFNIQLPVQQEPFSANLFNAQGQLIFQKEGIGDFQIDLKDQTTGIYYLKITQGGLQRVKKLVLQ